MNYYFLAFFDVGGGGVCSMARATSSKFPDIGLSPVGSLWFGFSFCSRGSAFCPIGSRSSRNLAVAEVPKSFYANPMMHPLETWLKCRRDYIEGKGFLPAVARVYGIPVATVQTRAKRERWSIARADFMERKHKLPDLELPAAPQTPLPETDNRAQKCNRLELQLERIDGMIDSATDPDALNKLASAKTRLLEQWRILSGIPLPGSRRPGKDRPRRENCFVRPLDV